MQPDVKVKAYSVDTSKPLYWLDRNGELHWNLHRGQWRVWNSEKQITLALAGTQSGKTVFGPLWMAREIQNHGPGDYLIASPTFKLLSLKLFPEFLRLFKSTCRWGDFTGRGGFQSRFLFSPYGQKALHGRAYSVPTQVYFGHAQNPDSLESATVKAAWLDECGQKAFKLGSWEAVQRRLAVHRGRVLATTTPYNLGWLKDLLFDPWRKAKGNHPNVEVVQFKSLENPAFPREEYDRAKATMPNWRFRLFYDAEFERPAGAIYDCFDKDKHTCDPFPIPGEWKKRFMGLDFGGVHTAAVYLAEEPASSNPRYFVYREYPGGSNWTSATAAVHAKSMLRSEPFRPTAVGGAGSEDQWREEFRVGGLPVAEPPVSEVEVGINRVYAMIKTDRLMVFNNCVGLLDQLQNYSRETDDAGNVMEDIVDKAEYHYCDALRYICSRLHGGMKKAWIQ
jgi:hypothetical protein